MLYGVWRSSEQPATVLDGPVTALVAPKPGATTDQPTSSSPSASSQPPSTAPATGAGSGPGVTEPGGAASPRDPTHPETSRSSRRSASRGHCARWRWPSRRTSASPPWPAPPSSTSRPLPTVRWSPSLTTAPSGSGSTSCYLSPRTPSSSGIASWMRSNAAAPRRRAVALIVLAPLKVEALAALPVTMQVSGARVTNLTCPLLPQPQQLCGRQDAQAWFTPALAADQAVVIVQADLPNPT